MVRSMVAGFFLIGVSMFLGCAREEAPKEKIYPIVGKIVEVDPGKQWAVLDHEDIPGLMKAMRMKFEVEDPAVLEGKKVGDTLRCRLKVTTEGHYHLLPPGS